MKTRFQVVYSLAIPLAAAIKNKVDRFIDWRINSLLCSHFVLCSQKSSFLNLTNPLSPNRTIRAAKAAKLLIKAFIRNSTLSK